MLPSILLARSGLTSIFLVHPALSSCVALADFSKWDKRKFCKRLGAGHGLGCLLLAPVCRFSTWYFILHVLPEASLDSSLKRQKALWML